MYLTFNGKKYRFEPMPNVVQPRYSWSHIGRSTGSTMTFNIYQDKDNPDQLYASYLPLFSQWDSYGVLRTYDVFHVDLNTGKQTKIT